MGTLFMVNPPKRKSRKRRTAAQKAATRKMLAANKKKRGTKKRRRTVAKTSSRKRAPVMAKRRRKRATTARRTVRRRRTAKGAKRRSPITTLRRRSVYMTNPRKRRRSRSRYRRNPGIVSQLKQGAMDAGATLVGGAVARMATGLVPLPKDGIAGAASGLAVALGVGIAARKIVSSDTARFITAGAMQVPIKNLITTFVPQAGAFLGDYDNVGTYALPQGVGDYLNPGSMYGSPQDSEVEVGVYE